MTTNPRGRERRSRLAPWSARLAELSVPVLVIAAVAHHLRWADATSTFAVIAMGFVIAAMAVIMAVAALMAIWRSGQRGIGAAVSGFFLGLLVLTIPAIGAWRLMSYPRLIDVSTNPEDPPQFVRALADRAADDVAVVNPGPAEIALQKSAYPDIVPHRYPVSTAGVFDAAKTIVKQRRWVVLADRAPSEANQTGRIEAVAVALLFGFRQDVVIAILPAGDGSLVEMRSAARNGAHDLGADAERIRKFFADLDAALQSDAG